MTTANTNITRDSNAELLRLVCMFFIVFLHILACGAYPEIWSGGTAIDTTDAKISVFLNGIFFFAVDIFILISGYYGIKPTLKKFFHLYIFCAFYSLLNYLARIVLTGQHLGRSLLFETLFPFTRSSYWFIPCYIALFCMAPLLNKFMQESNKKEYKGTILLLTFVNVYLGYFGHKSGINNGYCALQLVYVYVIGGYIRRFVNISKLKNKRFLFLALSILCGILWALSGLIQTKWSLLLHNHPFTIIGAVFFFIFAMTFSFQSKFINWLSSSALAVYLIQEAPMSKTYLYPAIKTIAENYYGGVNFLIFTVLALAITIACCLFDKIRVLLMKPVWIIYEKIEHRFNKVQKRFMDTV